MRLADVRAACGLIECIHAPVYFAPEPQREYAALGLRGFWRGYFAGRAAAVGSADAGEVTRLFGGFAPRMVDRAIPEIWTITTPERALAARQSGAVAALRRLVPVEAADAVARAATQLANIVDAADYTDRPLAAAHARVARPDEPLAALWHGCTVLRELRGDAHLAALAEDDLPWPQPHVLLAGTGRLDPNQRDYRGWTEEEWSAAADDLEAAGLLGTDAGRDLVERLERRTDELTAPAFAAIDVAGLIELLRPVAAPAAAQLPFPNAMGLPRPAELG